MKDYTSQKGKQEIREKIWKEMKEQGIERFPYAWGRIPNFDGATEAASHLERVREFREAEIIFVAPDSPQKPVRKLALLLGKMVVMPTPKLKSGFLLISPEEGKGKKEDTSSIRGALLHGKKINIVDIPLIDFIVQGAVAVDRTGNRVGKGGGYGDREIALLQEHGKIAKAKLAVTVHDMQVVEFSPQDSWDFTVDIIVTPTRILRTSKKRQEALSKHLSYILRHHPPETISGDGYCNVEECVALLRSRFNVSKEDLVSVVSSDKKGRFQMEGDRIRALYGHSHPVSIDLPAADIPVLYHGTSPEAAHRILVEGLKPQKRLKVHLSPTVSMAREVGKRHCDNPVILEINVSHALESGISIEKASDTVYVTDQIPPHYITRYE
ncbi:MAG: RNA 2'-phosphotransferase [Theionarchaea archaeon]|nr:RNA 2'-phosphotransferase [Theionarchaea archaeon]